MPSLTLTSYLPVRWTKSQSDPAPAPLDHSDNAAEEKNRAVELEDNKTVENDAAVTATDAELNPGELTFEEDAAGGMGRHLGVFSCTLLVVGRIVGTGIFSTPSSILGSVGSVGASLMLWVLGFVLSFCGLFIWLELGTMFPRSGGEKVYLEAVYKKPKHLATVIFASNAILLMFTSAGCIVFAQNLLIAAGREPDLWTTRGIALGATVFTTLMHAFAPYLGVWVMNALSTFKIIILLIVVIAGWVVLGGNTQVSDPYANFRDAFAGSSNSGNDYATAMFKVLFAYGGWNNVNYVMNNVKDPVRTLKIAGPLGLAICASLYVLANVAYFAAATKEEITQSGATVASLFFGNVFGEAAQKALTVFVALRYNVVTVTFASARVNQELAKEGIPLPFGNRFWASNWPTGRTPFPGLLLQLTLTAIVIIAPPPDIAYPFILDVQVYPQQFINLFVVIALFWLRWRRPDAPRPFRVWSPLSVFFLAATLFLIVAPFLPPANGVGDTPPLPYYLYCLVGIAVMVAAVVYWVAWRLAPGWLGYRLVSRKETLADGTVVTLFSQEKIE